MTHVLIVDDREENLYYLRTVMAGEGYAVETARHGAEALIKARRSPPSLIISDLLMPVMDGYTLLRHWKADEKLRRIPFIVYTATYTTSEDEQLALSLGADAFLVKPMEPDEIAARVRAVEVRATAAPPKSPSSSAPDDGALVTQYNAALVRKLEEKTIQLETANQALQQQIAERVAVESQANEMKVRLETLVAQATIGILVHRNFKPIVANDALARIFGYASRDEILAMESCRGLFADEEQERIESYNQQRLAGVDVPSFYAIKGRTKDGGELDLENRTFAIRWGEHLSVCAMLTDVTEQRELEARLRQSQRLEAIGQMTGGVAHDFNNLLTVILGNAELLMRDLAHDEVLHDMAQLTALAAQRAAELTNRLLAFSRRQTLDPRAVDINRLVSGMDVLLRRALGEHIEIKTVLGADLPAVLIDASQLENALLNLSVNARDAMPGGGRLTIETRAVHLDETYVADQRHALTGLSDVVSGQYVMIGVSDTGTGMDEATRLKAFDPFFTTKDVGKGSGLGLSMVYGFVKQSKGQVRIYSEPGHGTTVKLYLLPARGPEDDRAASPSGTTIPGGDEKILVVEDDDLVRRQVVVQLRTLGYDVTSAVDGVEALALLRDVPDFDLLFTDVVMPRGINGRQLADEALKLYPGMAVLFTSGYTEDAIVHHGRLDPGVNLLNKPYRRRDLAEKVRSALTRKPPARER